LFDNRPSGGWCDLMPNYKHFCKEWDFLEIDQDDPEYEACICNIDSDGLGPKFISGDRVLVGPNGMEATVIKQELSYDGPESFWGNVQLLYDDGIKGVSNSWQVKKIS
jgi:hypothetical protein